MAREDAEVSGHDAYEFQVPSFGYHVLAKHFLNAVDAADAAEPGGKQSVKRGILHYACGYVCTVA